MRISRYIVYFCNRSQSRRKRTPVLKAHQRMSVLNIICDRNVEVSKSAKIICALLLTLMGLLYPLHNDFLCGEFLIYLYQRGLLLYYLLTGLSTTSIPVIGNSPTLFALCTTILSFTNHAIIGTMGKTLLFLWTVPFARMANKLR